MILMYKEVPVNAGVVRITLSIVEGTAFPDILYHAQIAVNGVTYHSTVRTHALAMSGARESLYDHFEADLLRILASQLLKKPQSNKEPDETNEA